MTKDFIEDGSPDAPYAYIQWKGTDACFDFHCVCGAHLHHDGYFAYAVQCGRCARSWDMPAYVHPRPSTGEHEPIVLKECD